MVESREAKRLNNEGSASEIGKGTDKWKVRVCVKNPATATTERFSRTIQLEKRRGGWSDRAREKRLNDEIAKLRGEKEKELVQRGGGGDGTLSTLAEKWLKHVQQSGRVGPPTVAMYRRRLSNHVLPRLGRLPADRVGALELDSLYEQMLEQGLAPSTVAAVHATVVAMLRQAKRWKMITELPEARPPTAQSSEVEPPTPEQVWALIDKAVEQNLPHIALLIRLAALTGARRGELCGLQVSDLDWDANTLSIRRQIRLDGEALPKGRKPRLVALGPALIAQLEEYLGNERDTFGREPGPWLLSRDGGLTPLYPSRVSDTIKRLGDECGVKVHTHSLRHFHDTQLVAGGIDVVTIAKRAGHSAEMARRVYMHRVSAADVRAAETLEQVLSAEVQLPGPNA